MVQALPDTLIGVRDRALLLVGYAGAFRRSELVALDVEDLVETDEGLVVTIRRSKTDQESAGRELGLPYGSQLVTCPVRAVRRWRQVAAIDDGPLWRSIDRHGRMAGRLSPAAISRSSCHLGRSRPISAKLIAPVCLSRSIGNQRNSPTKLAPAASPDPACLLRSICLLRRKALARPVGRTTPRRVYPVGVLKSFRGSCLKVCRAYICPQFALALIWASSFPRRSSPRWLRPQRRSREDRARRS